MDIQIINSDKVISSCEEVLNYNKQISSQIDSLQTILNNINNRWESTGMDKESYIQELQKQIRNLTTMEKAINDTANSILRYAESIKITSNNTI